MFGFHEQLDACGQVVRDVSQTKQRRVADMRFQIAMTNRDLVFAVNALDFCCFDHRFQNKTGRESSESRPALKLSVLLAKLPVHSHASFARSLLHTEKPTYRRTNNSSSACVRWVRNSAHKTIGAAVKECQG